MVASRSPADRGSRRRRLVLLGCGAAALVAVVLLRERSAPLLPQLHAEGRAERSDSSAAPGAVASLTDRADAATVAPATPPPRRLDAAAAEREARGTAGPRVATATPGETIVERRGRVVLVNLDGRELAAPNGTLDLFYWRGSYGEEERGVEVIDGGFTLQAPSLAKSFDVERAMLDDAPAWVHERDLSLAGNDALLIHAQMLRATRLIVLADETGEPLDDVTVLDAELAEREEDLVDGWRNPDEAVLQRASAAELDSIELRHRRSPLVIPAPDSARDDPRWTLAVLAPGRATRRCDVDFAMGGDTTLRMVAGGELIVVCPPIPRPEALVAKPESDWDRNDDWTGVLPLLAVAGPEGAVLRSFAIGNELPTEMRFRNLPPDRHTITLERFERGGCAISEKVAVVPAGATLRVELEPPLPPPDHVVAVAGVLVLPEGDDDLPLRLRFELREPLDPDPYATETEEAEATGAAGPTLATLRSGAVWGLESIAATMNGHDFSLQRKEGARRGRRALPFDTGGMKRGRWRVTCEAPPIDIEFDTGPSGRSDLRLVARAIVTVQVALIDAATGGPAVGDGEIGWCSIPDGAEQSWGPFRLNDLDEQAARSLEVPAGRIQLMLRGALGAGYALPDPCIVVASPEQRRVEITVRRRAALTLHVTVRGESEPEAFTGRGARPPSHALWGALQLICLDAPDAAPSPPSIDEGSIRFGLPRSGRWRVEIGAIDGFESVDDFDLRVASAEWVERTIELVRR